VRPPEAPGAIAGLDLTRALGGLNGNWPLLRKLLEGFRASFAPAQEEIRAALDAGDLDLAASKVHTLKGVAGMLSASRLHDAAHRLEQDLPGPGWPEFQTALEELLDGIAAVLAPPAKPSHGDAGHGQDPDR
jgi:HPt (histidine-containing phosphotransfer) domain-containing protein